MVITVTCPSCSSAFPVDPAKIPEGGVNARCSSCGDIFRVEKPAAPPVMPKVKAMEPEPEAALPETPAVADPDPLPGFSEPAVEPEPEPVADPVTEASPVVDPEPADPFSEAAPFEAAGDAAPEAASGGVQGFTFGKRDPTDKAKRLARVLVSDMIMYNAERHQSALSAGTLVQDFEEEIDKSWKEYIDQVGEELANGAGRGFWTEALNAILAKGEQVF
ncbi:MAG: zinc-ribbon domain-containing protein [Longimicrobiales bacterium]